MEATAARFLSLSDISLLAHVRRPVVSTWKSRHPGGSHPFPMPARVDAGQEWFDLEQIIDWLEATRCGNNPDARADGIAFTLTAAEVGTDEQVFVGLTALICLRGSTGPLPTETDDLLDAADRFDPDDELVFDEIESLGGKLAPLARYAELLVASAFDPAEPFDEVVRRRQTRSRHQPLHPTLRRLVAKAAVSLADEAGFTEPTYVVRATDDADLVIAAGMLAEQLGPFQVAITMTADEQQSADIRLVRRWLRVHGMPQAHILADSEGAYELPDEAVLMLRLTATGAGRATDLNEVSNLCLNLSERNRAVVVGPSSSLIDALLEHRPPGRPVEGASASPAGALRSDALRTGAVRAVIRLPYGLFTDMSRTRAAMWCLGPSRSTRPATLCADISQTLNADRADDLITDLIMAMQGPETEHARQLTTARFRPTSDLSTTIQDLVTPTAREIHLGPAQVMASLLDVVDRAAMDIPGITRPDLSVSAAAATLSRVSLEDAVRQRKIILVPGARIDASTTSPGADSSVVRHPAELARRSQIPGLSVIDLATVYPHVSVTLPGDIVVTTVGGPAAAVDQLGGVVVAYPARVLRCHRPREADEVERQALAARGQHPQELAEQTFTPEAVVADINAQPASATNWKAWPLTVVPTSQISVLEGILSELAERRDQLDAARADIDTTIRTLTQAVGANICTISKPGEIRLAERTVA